jgi:hypothetical protein
MPEGTLASISGAKFTQKLTLTPAPIPPATLQLELFPVPGLFPDMIPLYNWFAPDGEQTVRVISIRIPKRDILEVLFWNFGPAPVTLPSIIFSLVCI